MLNVLTNGFIRKGVFGFVLFSILFININWNDISIKAGKTAVVVGITLVGGTIPSAEAIVPLAAGAVMVATAIIANPGVVALGAAGIYGASTKGGEFACKDIE
ncbi:MAG: hypothetical protein ORN26_00085 [Candidatus Pacebacteria bacterium]|nr:hypothetical protein [Candidatus Paceibacterota bacterium]